MSGWRRFARFNVVSGLGIGVQLAVLYALTIAEVHYLAATFLAVTAAVVHNFGWHWRWTWADRAVPGGWWRALATFALANGAISMGGNLMVMALLVGGLSMPPLPANLIAIGVCGLLNFLSGDWLVFPRPDRYKAGRDDRPRSSDSDHGAAHSPREVAARYPPVTRASTIS